MDQQQLRELEALCIQEEPPFCTAACPVHVDVSGLLTGLARGNAREARRVLDRTMPFPEIVGRLCEQPCRQACKRTELDEALAIGALERFCLENSSPVVKLPKLPAKGGKVAVIGAGLSGMVAALDLGRKGRLATLFTAAPGVGGSLRSLSAPQLPEEVLQRAEELLAHYGVSVRKEQQLDTSWWSTVVADFEAFYIDLDEISLGDLPEAGDEVDALTLALARDGWFAGAVGDGSQMIIAQASAGRRAALSIERYLQKVSLTAQRDREGAFVSKMYTSLAGVEVHPQVVPADASQGYSAEEAKAEAERCLHCQCAECVKQCVFLREYKEYPKTMVRKIFNSETIVQGTRTANKMINSCSLCGQCTEICPNDFPVAEVCRTSRQQMVEAGHMPPSAHEFALEDMQFSKSEYCQLLRHQPGTSTSRYLFYPGCQLAGSSPELVRATYGFLCDTLEGGVGLMLDCCGIPAHWSGQEAMFQQALAAFSDSVETMGHPEMITACSSCFSIFHEFTQAKVHSLWEVLDGNPLPDNRPALPAEPLCLHDPCTVRHLPEIRTHVRSLCSKLGLQTVEPQFSGTLTDCCGYGGLMQFANPPLGGKAAQVKAQRSEEDGLAYCAMCRDNLVASGTRTAHLLDYLFVGEGKEQPGARPNPGFSGRHENRARLKEQLLAELWQEEGPAAPRYRQISLELEAEVLERLNSRHILEEDVQKVIFQAEQEGRYLQNPENNHRLAYFRPVRVTYWVEYEPAGEHFRVHNAYSHRMQLPETLS